MSDSKDGTTGHPVARTASRSTKGATNMTSDGSQAPAFPLPQGYVPKDMQGLTRREYFVASAMQGLCQNASVYDVGYLAKKALEIADALIAALQEKQG